MKAIFLDIDGVIVTPTSVRLNYRLRREPTNQFFDFLALYYLSRLVRRTGAVVVLTSTWRRSIGREEPYYVGVMNNLFTWLKRAGAPYYDATPVLSRDSDRSDEVAAWLDDHPCEAYAILDDLAFFDHRPDVVDGHLVRIEDSEGIRREHYQQALGMLLADAPTQGG